MSNESKSSASSNALPATVLDELERLAITGEEAVRLMRQLVAQSAQANNNNNGPKCEHNKEALLWCAEEKVVACDNMCVGHPLAPIQNCAQTAMKSLDEKSEKARREGLDKVQKSGSDAKEAIDKVRAESDTLKTKVEADYKAMIKILEHQRDSILSTVSSVATEAEQALKQRVKEAAELGRLLERSISASESATAAVKNKPKDPNLCAMLLNQQSALEQGLSEATVEAARWVQSAEESISLSVRECCAMTSHYNLVRPVTVSDVRSSAAKWTVSPPIKDPPLPKTLINPPAVITPPSSSPFSHPRYVTVSSDLIFVTDPGTHSVFVFQMNGSSLPSIGPIPKGFAEGRFLDIYGITCVDGSLYVADGSTSRVYVLGLDGTFRHKWALPFKPHGLTFGGGLLFITDSVSHRIHSYRLDGAFERSFGSQAKTDGELQSPYGISYSSDHVFVVNFNGHSVSVFRSDGRFVRQWGSYGSGPGQLKHPWDVAVYDGKAFVADSSNHRISMFSTDGTYIRSVGSQGSGPNQFEGPIGIALTDRSAVIMDCNNKRLRSLPLNSLQ